MAFGNALIALQPPRGYGMNPDAIYHTPDLPPTHHYAAFYRWLGTPVRRAAGARTRSFTSASTARSNGYPERASGCRASVSPTRCSATCPLVYPFIVNDPGEGSQAKRRAHAVIIDHLMPPMTSADTYGPLAALNDLVNEYYAAEKLDATRLPIIQQQIWDLIQQTQLQADLDLRTMLARDHGDHKHEWDDELTPEGVPVTLAEMSGNDVAHLIEDIDGYLCELGTAQIRTGFIPRRNAAAPGHAARVDAPSERSRAGSPGIAGAPLRLGSTHAAGGPGARFERPRESRPSCVFHADAIERVEDLAAIFVVLEDAGFEEPAIDSLVIAGWAHRRGDSALLQFA